MQNIVVRAELVAPVIVQGWLTLDALLASQLFERTGDVERAHADIPLACRHGLWSGSAALFEDAKPVQVKFVAGLRAQHDLDPALIGRGRGGVMQAIGSKRRREFGNILSQYPARQVRAVWWFGQGSPDAVRSLLDDVKFVGKKHAQGYGEVVHIDVDVAKCDGIKDGAGYPLRPVPVALWQGKKDAVRDAETWRPAYFDLSGRALCVVPESVDRSVGELEALL